jgi:VWFA-related protein
MACAQAPPPVVSTPQSAPSAAASGAAKGTEPTVLRANANLVLLDVVVTKKDKPVYGLDRKQFHLLVDGREEPIASFDEHHSLQSAGAVPTKLPTLPANTYTNLPVYPNESAVTVLLLDGLNTPLADQMNLRHQMVAYLDKIQPGAQIAVFTMGQQLKMATSFTTDLGEVAQALKNAKGLLEQKGAFQTLEAAQESDQRENALQGINATPQPNGQYCVSCGGSAGPASLAQIIQQFQAETNSFQMDVRVKMTCDELQDLSRSLSVIPLRKNVIWFSAAFPLQIDPDTSLGDFTFEATRNYSDELEQTTRLLSDARIAIYPVDARGLMEPSQYNAAHNPTFAQGDLRHQSPDVGFRGQAATEDLQRTKEFASMEQIAQATGGKAYFDTNGLMDAVADTLNQGSNYYTIGYVPKELDGNFHKFHIRLDAGGDNVAYRSGYFAGPPAKPPPNPSAEGGILLAAHHGLPAATQILFVARILPATDQAFQGVKIPDAPASPGQAKLKGPAHRYVVDLEVVPQGLDFEKAPDGAAVAHVEFAVAAYDSGGNHVNYVYRASEVKVSGASYAAFMAVGLRDRLTIDLPDGEDSLRIVVHDLKADRSGSLEVPVTVSAK